MEGDGHAGGERPRRRGPDDDRDFAAFKLRIEIGGIGNERVLHVDRAAAVVFVFYFSLGKRRLVGDAPVDGLAPAVDVPSLEESQKRLGDHSFVLGVHRQVGLLPFPQDAQALEVPPLQINKLFGVAPACLSDLDHAHPAFAGPEFFVHVDLDG